VSSILDGLDRGLWWGRNHLRVAALGGALVVVAIAVAVVLLVGGGGRAKIPDSAVAVVGDAPISTASLNHWQGVVGKANSSASRGAARKSAFALLAGGTWVAQEAARQHVSATQRQIDAAEQQFFAQYQNASKQQVLSQLGVSEADLRFQERISLLTAALQSKVAKAVPAPSSQAIQAAYRNEPQRWAHPTKRDARLVVGSSQANAQAALAALRSGTSFSTVSKRYSADQTLSQNGGVAKGLVPGTTTAALERALFAAPAGRLEGPLHVGNGWVVFKVQRITKLADQTLAKATARIKQDLSSTAQSQAVDKYVGEMRRRWKAQTVCRPTVADANYCSS
jgi:parvulin-like peptidyl-prolyl isomerase